MTKRLLVCDLDNTLYDWVSYFVPSFYAMIDRVVAITGCDRDRLLDDFRSVHQRMSDSEHPFALLETETIKNLYANVPKADVLEILDPAFYAFNSSRKRQLVLYPGVIETLDTLTSSGIRLVAHTESKLFGVVDRLRRLDLTKYFSKVYCRERSGGKNSSNIEKQGWFDSFPLEKVTELSHHQAKPNPEVLLEICSSEGMTVGEMAYVGDSIARDVLMAKRAGVFSIWAAYGVPHDVTMYDALVRVSHWTPEEVVRERLLREEAKRIQPDYIANNGFSDVLTALGIREQFSIS